MNVAVIHFLLIELAFYRQIVPVHQHLQMFYCNFSFNPINDFE